MSDRLYIVAYDIRDPKRWRTIFRIMKGYGEWLQLSIFQCRLSKRDHADLIATLDQSIHHGDDHVMLMDLGPVESVKPRMVSLGRDFDPVKLEPTIL